MLAVETEVYSPWLHFLSRQVTESYLKRCIRSPALDEATGMLGSWNGQMEKSLAAPFLITLIYQYVRKAVAENASPGNGAVYDLQIAPSLIEKLLRERPPNWFRDYDQMLLRALADGLEEGTRIQGRDLKRWQYGSWLRVEIDHPVIHQIPWIGKYFDIGPLPMSGSATSVKQTSRGLMPSMRMTVEPGDWDQSLLNELTGQSGQILSRHYRDQWPDYYAGRSYRMQFRQVSAASTLRFQPAEGP
jgi:penicillin G amidase